MMKKLMIKFIISFISFFLIFQLIHIASVKFQMSSFWFKDILPSFIVALVAIFIFKKRNKS
ncbi:hypothetical protein AHS81_23035 [Salmonella enterica]|nr:hypothetical protein [Salmonella enterica]